MADVGEPAPRRAKTMKALLTDGVSDVGAVCQGWIDRLELGAKIFVEDAPVQRGVVLLRPDNRRVLDCLGHVKAEALAARAGGGGGPAAARRPRAAPAGARAARGAGARPPAPRGAAPPAGAAPAVPAARARRPAGARATRGPGATAATTTKAATAAAAATMPRARKPAIRPPSPKRQRSFGELLTLAQIPR